MIELAAFDAVDEASIDEGAQDALNGEGDSDRYLKHVADLIKSTTEKKAPNKVAER